MRPFLLTLLLLATHTAMSQTNVYCFSGLGADERAFANLRLPPGYRPVHIQWIRPHRSESLAAYALRIAHQVDAATPFVFLGLSFGGVVAQELSKSQPPQKLILLSSLTAPAQVKGPMGFISRSGLYRIIPFGLFTIPNKISYIAFGATDPQSKAVLHDILQDTSPQFFRWAAGAMTRWQPAPRSVPTIHLHGSADRIIPPTVVHPDQLIPGGGHLMVFNMADEVNRRIAAFLEG